MARVSQCFSKTLIAHKYLLGYSNTCEHFNRFGGSVNPFRNTGKDGVYDVREEEQDHRDHQLVGMVAVRKGHPTPSPVLCPSHWIHLDPCEEGSDNDGKVTVGGFFSPCTHPLCNCTHL